MANIVRWEPLRDMMTLRDTVDRMFEDRFGRAPMPFGWAEGSLALDMYETDDSVVVKTAIPGVKAEEMAPAVQALYREFFGS